MIYQELTEHEFARKLSENKDNGFSYEGAVELFHYYDGMRDDLEFDPVALRCDWSELTEEQLISEYSNYLDDLDSFASDSEKLEYIIECIEYESVIIKFDGGYLILNF